MKFKKALIIILSSMIVNASVAQELTVDATTNKVIYTEVLDIQGATKKALFDKARKWVITKNTAVNPYIISYESEQDGQVTAKGTFTLPAERRKYIVQFAIRIAVKAGKCKYEFTDLMIQHRT